MYAPKLDDEYHMAQNSGGGKLWKFGELNISQYFTQPNSRFTITAIAS